MGDLRSKEGEENSFSSKSNRGKIIIECYYFSLVTPMGVFFEKQPTITDVVDNVNKRMSRINFPGVKIGRFSKDDFEKEYKKELFALAKTIINE